ncbi:MAG TPA: hypothetical protein VF618_08125 [Thermoanaerobaculia bacterium]
MVISMGASARESGCGMVAGCFLSFVGGLVAAGAIAFIASWVFWGMKPHETTDASAARDVLSFPVGAPVTQVRSRTSSMPDSYKQFLRFHAPPPTMASLVSTRFKRSSADECRRDATHGRSDAPEWWTPAATPTAECYTAEPYDDSFASGMAWLHYDPSSGQAHFYYIAVD